MHYASPFSILNMNVYDVCFLKNCGLPWVWEDWDQGPEVGQLHSFSSLNKIYPQMPRTKRCNNNFWNHQWNIPTSGTSLTSDGKLLSYLATVTASPVKARMEFPCTTGLSLLTKQKINRKFTRFFIKLQPSYVETSHCAMLDWSSCWMITHCITKIQIQVDWRI